MATRLIGIGSLVLALAATIAAFPAAAHNRHAIDCPLRDQPYSMTSPLIDILLNPRAKAVLTQEAPDLLAGLPAGMFGTTAPSFAAIITPDTLAELKHVPKDAVARIDKALAVVAVTPADRIARCARYDVDRPALVIPAGKPRLLLFEKINGFRDGPSVEAARKAFEAMAARNGWALVVTDKGGAITPATLRKFDAVIWNNVSGDVLTLGQRAALKDYIDRGGGFVGVHGSGGDPAYFWDWYADTLIGARFIGHPGKPQFQSARVRIENAPSGIGDGLAPGWTMTDEWYSFKASPRASGATVVAALDESTYSPIDMFGRDLKMGDHPIAWTRCVGNGRSFYSAIGHLPQSYAEPHYVMMLENAVRWAAGEGRTQCRAGHEELRVTQAGRR